MLCSRALPTVQYFGILRPAPGLAEAQAIVVSLKTRSVEPERAVDLSLRALEAIRTHRPR